MFLWTLGFLYLGIATAHAEGLATHQLVAEPHIDQCSKTSNIANTTKRALPDGVNGWHPRKIDYREFSTVEVLQQDRMYVVAHPDFGTPVLIKMAALAMLDMPSLEREVAMYRRLHGVGITPDFLGHVTEDGRAVGFVTEYIQASDKTAPQVTRSRHNLQGCLAALRSLHQRGIAHGDAHDGNCLLREDGSAVLIDFELSKETRMAAEFERDLDIMDRCIRAIPDHV